MTPILFAAMLPALFAVILTFKSLTKIGDSQRAIVFRLGRVQKFLGPGLHISIPLIDQVKKVDLETQIPSWRAYSATQLESAIESFVLLGRVDLKFKEHGSSNNQSRSSMSASNGSSDEASKLTHWLLKAASEDTGFELQRDPLAVNRITDAAKMILKDRDSNQVFEVNLPFITADATGPKHFQLSLDKRRLDEILRKN